jgi:predicted transcriptional regulator
MLSGMSSNIPPVSEVRAKLERLTTAQLKLLAASSGVPYTTLWKVRDGTTENPGLETVRKFMTHIRTVERAAAQGLATERPCNHRER